MTKRYCHISVESKGTPAYCRRHVPFCNNGSEICHIGMCKSDATWDEGVAYCCSYAMGPLQCCRYEESCRDNIYQENECSIMYVLYTIK